jgi:uncharacterized membrane protein
MLSARVPTSDLVGAKVNMVWDGLFHATLWVVTTIGIWLLWAAAKRPGAILSGRSFVGSLLVGWGLFNLVEGIIDHHILNLHHVYEPMGQSVWDYLFLLWGGAMMTIGWLLRSGDQP